MIEYPSCFETPIHEFGHYLGLPHQYDGGLWSVMGQRNTNVSYCMNSFEREKMGWITFTDVTVDGTTASIADFASTGTAYRVSVPNSNTKFLVENHQGINEYDVVDVTSGGGKGLYILRQTTENASGLQVMNADGRWSWLNPDSAENPWAAGKYIPKYQRDTVLRNTGRTDRNRIPYTKPPRGSGATEFIYIWNDERSGNQTTGARKAGDGKDMWNTDVANMFSPWSNPSSASGDTATSNVGVEVTGTSGTNVNVKFYTTNPLNGPPSRPQDLRCWGTVDSSDIDTVRIYPRLTWSGNLEADVTSGGGYQIWKRDEPYTFGYGTWVLIDSVGGTTTMYVDSTIDDADTNDNGLHSASYRIRAYDSTGKLSTFSEIRGIYYGFEIVGGKLVASRAEEEMAGEVTLWPNRPNPFERATEIAYSLTRPGSVTVDVYAANGKRVAVLADGVEQEAGSYRLPFDGGTLPAGVYLCRVLVNGKAVARPITLSR